MRQAILGDLYQLSVTEGGTVPCHRERARNFHFIFIEEALHEARSWPSLCLESLIETTVSHIVTGGQKIEAALAKGYELEQVKIAMFKAMEGMAKDHAANIDQYGVLTALEILEGMDWLYGVSMTFQLLNAALCGLQQRATESCQDYYD